MIRVGFIGPVNNDWTGGVNYIKNLLSVVDSIKQNEVEIIILFGKKTDNNYIKNFSCFGKIKTTSLLDKYSLLWIISKICNKILKFDPLFIKYLKNRKINVLSHSGYTWRLKGNLKLFNWIPDFQHKYLKNMFSKKEIKNRDKNNLRIAKYSDVVFLSSNDAKADFIRFYKKYRDKAEILRFVVKPITNNFKVLQKEFNKKIKNKYNLSEKYFFLPNQFYKHKNHIAVFKAINTLKEKMPNIELVCTGSLKDHRNVNHIKYLTNYIKSKKLEENIKILGLIEYKYVHYLIKNSIAVINPSLFEGWSTTVEECKSLRKKMILSNIAVHKEQNPNNCEYFNVQNQNELINILNKIWLTKKSDQNEKIEINATEELADRINYFGKKYIEIVLSRMI